MPSIYDIAIIGSGPGGYNCAIRASQLGLRVACIEQRDTLGGTCLNIGCIPSKSLLHSSELLVSAQSEFAQCGIIATDISFDLNKMMAAKDDAVSKLTRGVDFLLKKNKIDVFYGKGEIKSKSVIEITDSTGATQQLTTKNIVIATGSIPVALPGIEIDEKTIATSTGALSFDSVPKKLVVIGGGVIGLELGSVWARLGSHVTVIEYADSIIPGADKEIADATLKIMTSPGLEFKTSTKVISASKDKQSNVIVECQHRNNNEPEHLKTDRVIVAVGRKAFTDGLGLESINVQLDQQGRVPRDESLMVTAGVWVIGDCTSGVMLAHKAEDEGIAVAEKIAGNPGLFEHELIPSVVYTSPEIAWVGKTSEQLDSEGIPYNVGHFPMMANSRANATGCKEGFVKILAHKETDLVLGTHIIAHGAGELIAEACLAMSMSASAEDIARTCHAHPTLSEAIRQAAMDVDGRAMQK